MFYHSWGVRISFEIGSLQYATVVLEYTNQNFRQS